MTGAPMLKERYGSETYGRSAYLLALSIAVAT